MKATFNEFKERIKWYFDENESLTLVWQHEKFKHCWRARLITNDNVITSTLITYLHEYCIGIQIENNEIYLYH